MSMDSTKVCFVGLSHSSVVELDIRKHNFPWPFRRKNCYRRMVVCGRVTLSPLCLLSTNHTRRGFNFGYSAWINSKFLGSNQGTNSYHGKIDKRNDTWDFDAEDLNKGDNALTVVLDPTGLHFFHMSERYLTSLAQVCTKTTVPTIFSRCVNHVVPKNSA